jgi:hypothetical protein
MAASVNEPAFGGLFHFRYLRVGNCAIAKILV